MLTLSIDNLLPEEFSPTPEQEGSQIIEAYPRITAITWFANPQPTEIAEIQYNSLDIAFTEIKAVPFLCYRGTVLPWQEMPVHLSAEHKENHPTKGNLQELQQETNIRLIATILLVSRPQRIIKAMRVGTLSNQLSTAYLQSLLRTQQQHTLSSYYATIDDIYQSYATNEIAERACHRCQLGD